MYDDTPVPPTSPPKTPSLAQPHLHLEIPTHRRSTNNHAVQNIIFCKTATVEDKTTPLLSFFAQCTPIFHLDTECFWWGKNEEGFLFYFTHAPRCLQSCCSSASPSPPTCWRPRYQEGDDRYLPPKWPTDPCHCTSTR